MNEHPSTTRISSIEFRLREIDGDSKLDIERVVFSGVALVEPFFEGDPLLDQEPFVNSLFVLPELERSISKPSGDYLLFTSVTGIADDAGWDLIHVEHHGARTSWKFERDGAPLHFQFHEGEYRSAVKTIVEAARMCTLPLEPKYFCYPE